jgi:hypothetical protein
VDAAEFGALSFNPIIHETQYTTVLCPDRVTDSDGGQGRVQGRPGASDAAGPGSRKPRIQTKGLYQDTFILRLNRMNPA